MGAQPSVFSIFRSCCSEEHLKQTLRDELFIPVWEYLDEHNEWRRVAASYRETVEDAYCSSRHACEANVGNKQYDVNFQAMIQKNKATEVSRPILHELHWMMMPPRGRLSAKLPRRWSRPDSLLLSKRTSLLSNL